jgi:hypothetical protein
LGERQTEDLKVTCSIHVHRIYFFLFLFFAIDPNSNFDIFFFFFAIESTSNFDILWVFFAYCIVAGLQPKDFLPRLKHITGAPVCRLIAARQSHFAGAPVCRYLSPVPIPALVPLIPRVQMFFDSIDSSGDCRI